MEFLTHHKSIVQVGIFIYHLISSRCKEWRPCAAPCQKEEKFSPAEFKSVSMNESCMKIKEIWPFLTIMSKHVVNPPFSVSLVSFPGKPSTTSYKELSSSFAAFAFKSRTKRGATNLDASMMCMLPLVIFVWLTGEIGPEFVLRSRSSCELQICKVDKKWGHLLVAQSKEIFLWDSDDLT